LSGTTCPIRTSLELSYTISPAECAQHDTSSCSPSTNERCAPHGLGIYIDPPSRGISSKNEQRSDLWTTKIFDLALPYHNHYCLFNSTQDGSTLGGSKAFCGVLVWSSDHGGTSVTSLIVRARPRSTGHGATGRLAEFSRDKFCSRFGKLVDAVSQQT
jgi:hypothetical protein